MVPLATTLTSANAGLTLAVGPLGKRPMHAEMLPMALSGLRGGWWRRKHPHEARLAMSR